MLHQIKAKQLDTDKSIMLSPMETVKNKDFSRHNSDFPTLFKADYIFMDVSYPTSVRYA